MKKIIYILLTTLLLTSCDLESEMKDKYTEDVVWQSENYVDLYVKGAYVALRANAEVATDKFSDAYADILKYSVNNLDGRTDQNKIVLQNNFITPNNGALSAWGNYDRIKRQNEFLYDVDSKGAHLDPEFVKTRKAEVRFLRAYLYYKMIRNHGGVIMRLHNSGLGGGLDTNIDVAKPRATEEESWNFVIKELEEVAADLKGHTWDSDNYGRVTEGAALALLTRVALYAKQYDKVIAAGKEVEKLGYELDANYENVFKSLTSKELILTVAFARPEFTHEHDRQFRPTGDMAGRGGWAGPTEELVSQYQIKENGKYVDFDWNNPIHKANPYQNREPRFYASILYNGADWAGRKIETFVGGKDGFVEYEFSSNNPACVTGYFMKKFLQEDNSDFDQKGSTAHWVEIRYAEVLTNMAEAYAQKGDVATAYTYLNKVRTRGGELPPYAAGSNLSVFMKNLEREKMVEFAFEGQRYWDLRRWKRAVDVIDGKRVSGVKITKAEDGALTYQIVDCDKEDRTFPEKYYYIPIPQAEISNNIECVQTSPW